MARHPWTELAWRPGRLERYEKRFCPHCDREVLAIAPLRGMRWALPVIGAGVLLSLVASTLLGPVALLVLVPMIVLALALGPAIAQARAPAICSRCRRETPFGTREEALAREGSPPP